MTTSEPPAHRPPARRPLTAVVLFDMGGVLVELGPLHELLGAPMPSEEFWPVWLASPVVRRFERGLCDVDEFGHGLVGELALDISADEVVDRFRSFPRGLYPGAAEMVGSVVESVRTGVLSNTNSLHWDHQADAPVLKELFDHRFLSYELGLVKPDTAIFERVVADLGVAPQEVLFLDDNQINVDGARAVGLDAHRAAGVAETRHILEQRQLIDA